MLTPGIRRCTKCWKEYNNLNFVRCDICRERSRRRLRKRYKAWRSLIRDIKSNGFCVDCGEDDPAVLDFDHLYNKKFNISRGMSKPLEQLKEEVKKCELRCSNCHRRKTNGLPVKRYHKPTARALVKQLLKNPEDFIEKVSKKTAYSD